MTSKVTSHPMDPDTTEHILPVPNIIEIPNIDRRQMDAYVDAFDAPQHGYSIRIANSHAGSHLCHYECSRSGFPPGKPKDTKSLRIGCRFRLSARFLPGKRCWLLVHTHLGHNHLADAEVSRRKKTLATQPILPRPYHLTLKKQQIDPQIEQQTPAPEPQNQDHTSSITSNSIDSIDLTISTLRIRLQALTPQRRRETVVKIESIFAEQNSSPCHPTVEPSSGRDLPPFEEPTNSEIIKFRSNSPYTITPTLDEFLTIPRTVSPHQSPNHDTKAPANESSHSLDHLLNHGVEPLSIEQSVDNVFDEFFGLSENTNSTFNLEDLLFHPDSKSQEDDPSPKSTQAILSPLDTNTNVDPKQTPSDITLPNLCLTKTDTAAQTLPRTNAEPRITRRRARELANTHSDVRKPDEAATTTLTTNTNYSGSKPIRSITCKRMSEEALAHSPTNTTHPSQARLDSKHLNMTASAQTQPPSGRVTRKRTRARNTSIDDSTLLKLLKKYQIHAWLQPFVLNLHEVHADGHCGFRAIAASIGRSQDDWLYVRRSLIKTLERWPNIFTDQRLPEPRTVLLTRLDTQEPNVLSQEEHWLSMPGIGGVIATTFDRPVLYYEPGHSSQVVFPYLTPINNKPPIVLVWAKRHFASVTLDYKNPKLPVPRVCPTWCRFRSLMASTWLPMWNPMIEKHAEFLASKNKGKRKKISQPTTLYDSDISSPE